MPHIHGAPRDQVLLFPPSLDEYITDDNPIRFIRLHRKYTLSNFFAASECGKRAAESYFRLSLLTPLSTSLICTSSASRALSLRRLAAQPTIQLICSSCISMAISTDCAPLVCSNARRDAILS